MLVPKSMSVVLNRVLPATLLNRLKAAYTVYHRREVKRINQRLLGLVLSEQPGQVQSGPFKGMIYGQTQTPFVTVSKWLGAYESELHPALERLCRKPFSRVINIGCAEGYYSVGLALRFPAAKVIAFDMDPREMEACRDLARINGVQDRVEVRGACDLQSLRELVQKQTLVVCDCEGAELLLLDPVAVPALIGADMLVELHDFLDARISPCLKTRFIQTHRLEIIKSRPTSPNRYPQLDRLRPKDQALALEEFRAVPMEWAIFESILKPSGELQ
jgi:hypothetical protein